MTTVRDAAEDYLAVRRALGSKLEPYGRLLARFAGYLERAGARVITTDLAVAWARLPAGADPRWWNRRLGVVRGFARRRQRRRDRPVAPPVQPAVPRIWRNQRLAAVAEYRGHTAMSGMELCQ